MLLENIKFSRNRSLLINIDRLDVLPDRVTALIGPNGAGKSTLLKILCRELREDSGSIVFHDRNIKDWSRFELARHVAILPQSSNLVFPFTAYEVVTLGATPLRLTQNAMRQMVEQAMKNTGCLDLKDTSFMALSGGQQQRVQLARVLVQLSQADKPPLLLLDEPTSAQDLAQQHKLLEQTTVFAKEKGYYVVVVLHDLNHVLNYADDVVILKNGSVVETGSPDLLKSQRILENVWGYTPRLSHSSNSTTVIY